jgi:hypothetical protein
MLREQVPDDAAIALRGDDLVGPQMAEGLRDGGVVDSAVAAARSETLIGPAAWIHVSRVSRVGSASTAKHPARARTDPGSPRAAMAWQTRSASMIR